MMTYANGDLIELAKSGKYDVIAHGCNCFNTMGAGVARAIAKNFPEAYLLDQSTKAGDKDKLGTIGSVTVLVADKKPLIIVNAYTQFDYGDPKFGPYVKYHAVIKCFKLIHEQFGKNGLKFGIPKIGSGLAGGSWNIIEHIIRHQMLSENIEVVVKE